ncbi:MAG: SDR family NAD(P)-dependent oxidoreductase [Bacteroidia bacterium]
MAQGYRLIEHFLFPPTSFRMERLRAAVGGKSILLTGASYGIGETLAMRLGEAGARLILVGRTEEKLLEVQLAIQAVGGEAEIFVADLRDTAAVESLIAFIRSRPQGLDIFVNNAGKSIRRSIFDSLDRLHDFERTMALNYHAPVQLCLGLMPLLVASRGQIINISALNVLLAPAPKWAAYQASKTAFDQWLRSVGPEVWAKGVSTCSIYLPLVRTRMIEPTEQYKNAPAMSTEHVARIVGKCIYKRRRRHKPWWLIFPELGSVMGRRLWERISLRKIQRSSDV